MFTRASDPVIPSQQAVLFYLYSPDLIALREHLLASGVKVSSITYPEYIPREKFASPILTDMCCSSGKRDS
jgi:hypothetical protein